MATNEQNPPLDCLWSQAEFAIRGRRRLSRHESKFVATMPTTVIESTPTQSIGCGELAARLDRAKK